MKQVYIAEKPSVAKAFAQVLGINGSGRDGYMESGDAIVTWCVGHLVTMSYPEVYDPALKRWSLEPLPFIPKKYLYEVADSVRKQFQIVSSILNRPDVDVIYVCTDAGREGEYIYRLVEHQAHVQGKVRKRVWIDSQTDEEIRRGIATAKDLSEYDNLSAAAYLRAKEDYLMGINFSRVLSLKYAITIKNYLHLDKCVIAIGRVMTCVLGIVVDREREIRNFTKTPYYGLEADFSSADDAKEADLQAQTSQSESAVKMEATSNSTAENTTSQDGESQEKKTLNITGLWKVMPGSRYEDSPLLYNEKGFKEEATVKELEQAIRAGKATVFKVEKKTEKKQAPLLYNLAELQNDCSRFFKISPDQTLTIAQELYEKKLTTYPRTDARVLSSAVAKVIKTNVTGLMSFEPVAIYAKSVLQHKADEGISKTRYVNDKQVTDHYAIIPTGQGMQAVRSLSPLSRAVYECICRRFLAIFFPPAIYEKLGLTIAVETEEHHYAAQQNSMKDGENQSAVKERMPEGQSENKCYSEYFISNYRLLSQKGYLHVLEKMSRKNMTETSSASAQAQAENAVPGTENPQSQKMPAQQDANTVAVAGETDGDKDEAAAEQGTVVDEALMNRLKLLKKGMSLTLTDSRVKESETSPPKRYNSGSLILTMENAGQFIEDDDLREQIKGMGIGTSATRAETLKKLVTNGYLALNTKTQIVTPTQLGEMIYETVLVSMRSMLLPVLTASWERGLAGVAAGTISEQEYMDKMEDFIRKLVESVKTSSLNYMLIPRFNQIAPFYANSKKGQTGGKTAGGKRGSAKAKTKSGKTTAKANSSKK